jgi:hypothetical protein
MWRRQSYLTTGGFSPIISSWLQAPSGSRQEIFFQLSPCGHSPYVTSSLTRRWVCLLWICLALVNCTYRTYSMLLKILPFALYTSPLSVHALQGRPCLSYLSYATMSASQFNRRKLDWAHSTCLQMPFALIAMTLSGKWILADHYSVFFWHSSTEICHDLMHYSGYRTGSLYWQTCLWQILLLWLRCLSWRCVSA